MHILFTFAQGNTRVQAVGTIYYCDKASGRCLLEPIAAAWPLIVDADAASSNVVVSIAIDVPAEVS